MITSNDVTSIEVAEYGDFGSDLENELWVVSFEETSNDLATIETAPEDFEQLYKWFIS